LEGSPQHSGGVDVSGVGDRHSTGPAPVVFGHEPSAVTDPDLLEVGGDVDPSTNG
jgi:hypothetical protein